MGKPGKTLKSALQSQQHRLHAKGKVVQASKVASKKFNSKGKQAIRHATVPFKSSDLILLIGEGNFSFARALIHHGIHPANICATAYDDEGGCYNKYPDARAIVSELLSKGVQIFFGVDSTKLDKHPSLKGRTWDRVVWNFPHIGQGITDQDRNILSNQTVILGFLKSAAQVLKKGSVPRVHQKRKQKTQEDEDELLDGGDEPEDFQGTILITLRNVPPYTLWDVPALAKRPQVELKNPIYVQLRSFIFHRDMWEGYEHRMTKGERKGGLGKTGEGGEDRTWEFYLAAE